MIRRKGFAIFIILPLLILVLSFQNCMYGGDGTSTENPFGEFVDKVKVSISAFNPRPS